MRDILRYNRITNGSYPIPFMQLLFRIGILTVKMLISVIDLQLDVHRIVSTAACVGKQQRNAALTNFMFI